MSSKRFAYIAVAVLFVASLGLAHAQVPVRANIPFDFVASGKTMPLGLTRSTKHCQTTIRSWQSAMGGDTAF